MKSKNSGNKGMARNLECKTSGNGSFVKANATNFTNFVNFINIANFTNNCALHFHTKQKNHLEYLLLSIK